MMKNQLDNANNIAENRWEVQPFWKGNIEMRQCSNEIARSD